MENIKVFVSVLKTELNKSFGQAGHSFAEVSIEFGSCKSIT